MSRLLLCVVAFTFLLRSQPRPEASQPSPALATVTIEGRVVDLRDEGVALADVTIETSHAPHAPLGRAVCDGEGCFRIANVPNLASWRIHAASRSHCDGFATLEGSPHPVRIAIHDATIVRGVLRSRDGLPVPHATVRAQSQSEILRDHHDDGMTDGMGRFRLERVPLGRTRFSAFVPHEGMATMIVHVGNDAEIVLEPDPEDSASLSIVVTGLPEDTDAPIRVSLLASDGVGPVLLPPPLDAPSLGPEGAWRAENLPDLRYRVTLTSPEFVFAPRSVCLAKRKGPHEVRFVATPLSSSRLRTIAVLRDAEGEPVVGARLALRHADSEERAIATSDGEGRLTFATPWAADEDAIVMSLDDARVLDQPKPVKRDASADLRHLAEHQFKLHPSRTLQLRAIPACTVQGRFLLADRTPAAFVTVDLESEDRPGSGTWTGFCRTRTDREGRFVIPRLHDTRNALRVRTHGHLGHATSRAFTLPSPGSHVHLGDLVLEIPARIEGVVFDMDARPRSGVRVWACALDPDHDDRPWTRVEVLSDREGRYRFAGVAAGRASVRFVRVCPDGLQLGVDSHSRILELEPGTTHSRDLVDRD